jgi:D-serine deaminase-like pyridoxal phosphate-dependent protein
LPWPGDRRAAARTATPFSVFIEIDSGAGRAGLPYPELPGLLDIARVLHAAPASSWPA